jgi:hypothetical protein
MIKNEVTQAVARNMAAQILENPVCSLGETIQGILCYIVEQQDRFPEAASLMEAILQNLCEALEPEQAVL